MGCGVLVATVFLMPPGHGGEVIASSDDPNGPPAAPGAVAAGVIGSQVRVAWTPAIGPAATAFLVTAGRVPGGDDLGSVAVATPNFHATDVAAGVYYLRVRAVNAAGLSAPSPELTVIVGTGLPGTPVGLLAAAGPGGDVRLAWQPPTSGAPPSGYELLVGVAPDRPTVRVSVMGRAFAARGVAAGTYFVRAVAINGVGAGPASPEILVVVP